MLLAYLALLAATPARCAPVELAVAGDGEAFAKTAISAELVRMTSKNFARAYAKACGDGLIKGQVLPRRLYLLNAPAANVASIYRTGKIMVLEYPFVTDGRASVPSIDELHDAIYCAVHGASAAEQEESGRCLPD